MTKVSRNVIIYVNQLTLVLFKNGGSYETN